MENLFKFKVFVVIVPCSLAISGCQTANSNVTTSLSFCQAAQPILWSDKDTSQTIGQIKEHNAIGRVACNWGQK